MRKHKTEIDEFEGFASEQYRPEDYGLTEENGYTRYILYENSGELFRTQADCQRKNQCCSVCFISMFERESHTL